MVIILGRVASVLRRSARKLVDGVDLDELFNKDMLWSEAVDAESVTE